MSSVNRVIFHSQSVLAPGVLFPNMSGGVVVQMMMSHTTHHVTELMVQYAGLTWRVVQQYCEASTLSVGCCCSPKYKRCSIRANICSNSRRQGSTLIFQGRLQGIRLSKPSTSRVIFSILRLNPASRVAFTPESDELLGFFIPSVVSQASPRS